MCARGNLARAPCRRGKKVGCPAAEPEAARVAAVTDKLQVAIRALLARHSPLCQRPALHPTFSRSGFQGAAAAAMSKRNIVAYTKALVRAGVIDQPVWMAALER